MIFCGLKFMENAVLERELEVRSWRHGSEWKVVYKMFLKEVLCNFSVFGNV